MTDRKISWYRTRLDPKELQALTAKSDAKALAQAGSFLLIFLATTSISVFLFLRQLWIPMVIACYLHSMFLFFISMAAGVHELSHGTAFKSKRLNDFFYYIFCFLSWNNPVHFRASHTYHHLYTVHRGTDLEVQQVPVAEKLNWKQVIFWFTFNAPVFWSWTKVAVLHALGKGEVDYFFWKPLFEKDDPKRAAMIRFARVLLLGHLALAVLFAVLQLWVLIYLVTFGVFFATFLGMYCGAMQHTGLSETTPDWRLVCHSVECGPLIRYLYWNMNYHTEHHMYAAVPFYNLRRLHVLVAEDFPIPERSFLAAIATLYRIRREQRKNPSYIYVPVFPPTAGAPRWKEGVE